MTDITELAQRMKTAAEELLSTGGISNYRRGQLAMQKFLAQASAENILALVEALERAQQLICEPIYRHAQPAPVVPEEITAKQASRSYVGDVRGYRDGWNACRAAMLNGGKS